MKLLVVGSGGREHALLWKLRRDAPGAELFFTGANAGMAELGESVGIASEDAAGLVELARRREIDLAVVGPETPLAAGLVDAFAAAGLAAFGPRRAAAEIESSKAFAKAFMLRHGVPTARFRSFRQWASAEAFLRAGTGPIVVKASGLAGGKGAVVCADREEALAVAEEMLRLGRYGEAGREIVVEDRLAGPELSVIALTDGEALLTLPPARDHKRALDGERGPNTGGMGAIVPVPDAGPAVLEDVEERILRPILAGLAAEGRRFRGALYAGLILTEGGPQVVEFNARFGDPETEVLLPLLESSLLELLLACAEGPPRSERAPRLAELQPRWREAAACCVVAVAEGYPGAYARGLPIELELGDGRAEPEALVFHAGTTRAGGRLVTAGGRVLAVTGVGSHPAAAREAAYRRLARVSFPGMRYRRDIGLPAGAGVHA